MKQNGVRIRTRIFEVILVFNLYSVRRFSVLADGAIGDIEKILSGSNLLDRSAEKTIRKSERKWEGGSVNGIPADFLYVADIALSTSPFIHESERLKKLIDEANEIGDTATALKYCNEILVVYPYDHDVLRMRLVLNSRLGNEAEVAADEELLKKLNEVKFRYRPDRIFDKEAALLPVPEDSVTVFYNRDWHITSRGNAVYFRKGVWSLSSNFFTGTVYDYLLEDGSMVSQVTYTPELEKTGIYIFQSPNGNKLAEGNFEKDRMSGSWNFYKEDGNLHYVVSFSDDQFEFESLIDDQMNDAVLADNQDFELILNDVFVLSGTFENGKRAKTWKLEVNGRTLLQEVYKEDEFESGFYFNNGERLPLSSSQLKSVIFNPGRLEIIERLVFDNRESFDSYEFINTDVLK